LRELVVRGGGTVEGKPSRGRPLLHDVDGWSRRTFALVREYHRGIARQVLLVLVLVTFLMVLALGLVLSLVARRIVLLEVLLGLLRPFVIIEVSVLMGYLVAHHGILWLMRSHHRRGEAVPGLYEDGLQVPSQDPFRHVFLPWEELGRVEGTDDPDTEGVDLEVRSRVEGWIATIACTFLGPEGVALLLEVPKERATADRPNLVVYDG
jgi:hypothetical protein